jgi:hypothetical protein
MQKPQYGPFIGGSSILGKGEPAVVFLYYTKQQSKRYYLASQFTILRLVKSSRRKLGHRTTVVSVALRVTCPFVEEVREAIHRSQTAFQSGVWSRTSTLHWSMMLSRLAQFLANRIMELTQLDSQQTGRTIREIRAQLGCLPVSSAFPSSLRSTINLFVMNTMRLFFARTLASWPQPRVNC